MGSKKFSDMLAHNESALRELTDETLKKIAHELSWCCSRPRRWAGRGLESRMPPMPGPVPGRRWPRFYNCGVTLSSVRRRVTGWIAILAVLMSSLAPVLSQAFAGAVGADWVEVCTVQGSKWVKTGEDGSERAPASGHLLDHCPYCSLQTPTLGLPPPAPAALLPLPLAHEVPPAFLAAPYTLHAWVRAQPRAPPFS